MFTIIEHGQVFAPEPLGERSILIVGNTVARVGEVDADAVAASSCLA